MAEKSPTVVSFVTEARKVAPRKLSLIKFLETDSAFRVDGGKLALVPVPQGNDHFAFLRR